MGSEIILYKNAEGNIKITATMKKFGNPKFQQKAIKE